MPNPSDRHHIAPPPGIAEWRDGQEEIVAEILAHFDAGCRAVLLDAPTGIGKSVITTGAAYNLGGRCLYTSTTKALQADVAKKIQGAVRLVGKGNYPAVNDPTLRCDDCRNRSLCPDLRTTGGIERCPYRLAKMRALAAPVAVLNTPYFVLEANHVGSFSDWDLLVLDEAEEIEKVIRRAATVGISGARIKQLGIDPPRNGAGTADVLEWVEVELAPRLDDKIRSAKRTLETIPPAGRQAIAVGRDLGRLERLRQTIRFQVEAGDDNLVGHIDEQHGTVVLEPILAGPYGQSLLWRHADRFLLASGSFIDTDWTMRDLGWAKSDPSAVVSCPSPFPVERRRIVKRYAGSMTRDHAEATMPDLIAGCRRILAAHHGQRGLIQGVAYGRCREIVEKVDDPRLILATRQDDAPPEDGRLQEDPDLRRLEARPDGVLVSPRHDRGVDLVGDLCRFIICVKKPLEPPTDPRVRARKGLRDGYPWYFFAAPARKTTQMTGRGNRSIDDYCTIYLLDSDFEVLLNSGAMPEWWMAAVQ